MVPRPLLLSLALAATLSTGCNRAHEPIREVPPGGARVRVMVPGLGPGWRTGMFNQTRTEPPCYLVLLFDPGPIRQIATTIYIGAVSRLQVSSLYQGQGGTMDPDPGASSYDSEQWIDYSLDSAMAVSRGCPATISREGGGER